MYDLVYIYYMLTMHTKGDEIQMKMNKNIIKVALISALATMSMVVTALAGSPRG